MTSSLCGSPVGPACLTCRLVDCDAMTAAVATAIRKCGRDGGLTGRDAALIVTLFGGTLAPADPPDETPHRRLRLV